jgi:enoyl-CoA hydratase/carnithine racemase
MSGSVLFERRDDVAIVTLNRPEVLNAIDASMRSELPVAITAAERDPVVRAIILTGAGDRAFSAGADIKEFGAYTSLTETRAARQGRRWNDVLESTTKPTIAAIHGFCLGGGLEIALACDLRVASHESFFALPEVKLGIIPGAGGTQRLPRIVGLGHALRLILSGERIDASAALQIGLVSELVTRAELMPTALAWASKFAAAAPLALAYAKEAVRRGLDLPLDEGLKVENDLATLLLGTDDRAEGAAAFRDRRKPVYRGR